jgi:hypothetical protein
MHGKNIQALCIVFLVGVVAYLYVSHGHRVDDLQRRIHALEARSKTAQDDYERQIARLRSEGSRRPSGGATFSSPRTLVADAVTKSVTGPGAKIVGIHDLRAALKLDESQERWVRSILDDFARAPGQIFAQARAERRFIFDPKTVEAVDDARRIALDRLKSVLTREQYTLLADGLDEKLGLRIAPPPR